MGTRHNCCDQLTPFEGQKMVTYHITAKYCVENPFWLRMAKLFRTLARKVFALSLVASRNLKNYASPALLFGLGSHFESASITRKEGGRQPG